MMTDFSPYLQGVLKRAGFKPNVHNSALDTEFVRVTMMQDGVIRIAVMNKPGWSAVIWSVECGRLMPHTLIGTNIKEAVKWSKDNLTSAK